MASKKSKNMHVVPHDGRWVVRIEGKSRATSIHDTKRDAINEARKIAQNERSELVIHQLDGRISERDSYGSDPLPAKLPRKILFPHARTAKSIRAIREAIKEIRESQQRVTEK